MNGPECRSQAPVAEGGPVGFSTGGTDGTGSPGAGGLRAASGRLKSDVKLFNAFVIILWNWYRVPGISHITRTRRHHLRRKNPIGNFWRACQSGEFLVIS